MKRIRLPFIELFKKISLLIALLITITVSTNAQSLFSTVADAVNTGGNCYRLTTAEVSKRGAVWYNNKIDLNNNFDISYTLNFGNRSSWSGGDGMAFVLQPAGLTQIGISGSGKGYGNVYDAQGNITVPGISPSVVVEYDTYDDVGGTNALISLLLNGDFRRTVPANTPVNQVSMGFVNDGLDHACRVTWNAGTKTITAYTDGVQRYSYVIDMAASVFSNQNLVYFGFTAGTGGSVNQQSVCFTASASTFTTPLTLGTPNLTDPCAGVNNGSATVNFSGGVAPFTVTIDNQSANTIITSANNATFNNLAAGSHVFNVTGANSVQVNGSFALNSLPAVTANITASGPLNFCSGGSVTLTASPGTSYLWSTGATTNAITVSSGGNYTVTVTNGACSATSSNGVFISEPALPVITASGPTTFCDGGSVDLSVSAAGKSLQFNSLGKYVEAPSTPAISLANALTVEAWVKTDLTDRPQYIVSKGRDDLMNGQYGILINGNIFQFHLYQNGHQGVNSNTTIQPGVWYHVAGTWDGITAKIYVNGVLDNSAPFLGPLTPNTQALEIGRIGIVDGIFGGSIDYPFYGEIDEIRIWNNARTASEINNNKNITVAASPALVAYYPFDEGSGSLASDVANGNTATLLDAVSPPQWMVSGAPINYATYAWSPGSAVTPTLHVTSSGSYFANVTSGNGCSYQTNSLGITVNPLPTINSVTGSTTICAGNTTTLTASSASVNPVFNWYDATGNNLLSTGTTFTTPNLVTNTTYYVEVTDAFGCTSATRQSVNVIVNALPPTPTISASGSLVLCSYNSVVLTSSASSGNSWSNGATTQTITVTPATVGSYTVTVSNGPCSATSAATVVSNAPAFVSSITASGPTLICDGTSVTYTLNEPVPDASRTWYRYFNGSYDNTFNQTGLSIVVTKSGNYGVNIIDAYGCFSNPPGSHDVTVLPPPSKPVAFTVSGTGSCTPNSGSVSATIDFTSGVAPINMTWDDGNGFTTHAQSINNVPPGIYTATVYDYCGTTVIKTFTVTGAVTAATISATSTFLCSGNSATVSVTNVDVSLTYQWYVNGTIINGATGTSYVATTAGNYQVLASNGGCSAFSTSILINAANPIPLTVTPTSSTNGVSCFNGGGSASADFSGGTAPHTFMGWTGPDGFTSNSNYINNLAPGTYIATQRDFCGVLATGSITFIAGAALALPTVTASAPYCGNNSVTLTLGSTPYSFEWNKFDLITNLFVGTFSPNQSLIVLPSDAGYYYYPVLKDANNCYGYPAGFSTTAPLPLSITVNGNPSCGGPNAGSASVNQTIGGKSPFTYAWTDGDSFSSSNSSIINIPGGIYTVKVTDACANAVSQSVTITGQVTTATITTTSTNVCSGSSAVLSITNYNIANTYQWQKDFIDIPGATGATYAANLQGSYNVRVSNGVCSNGSNGIFISFVSSLSITINATPSCGGPSFGSAFVQISGGKSPFTYAWTDGGTFSSTASFVNNLSAGTYTVTVTDACGTPVSKSFTISVLPAITVSISGVLGICTVGGSTTLSANTNGTPASYNWGRFNGSVFTSLVTTQSFSTTVADNYAVSIKDINGCNSFMTFTVTAAGTPLVLTVTGNPSCGGTNFGNATASFSGVYPLTIAWSDGGNFSSTTTTSTNTINSIFNLPGGTYTATVTDGCGSTLSKSFTVSSQVTAATITSTSTIVCSGASSLLTIANVNPLLSYQWYKDGSLIAGATGTSYSASLQGNYQVNASNGICSFLSSGVFVTVRTQTLPFDFTVTSTNSCGGTNHGSASASNFIGGVTGYTFLGWTSGGNFISSNTFINNLPGGVYTFTAKDFCGTIVAKSVTIIEPAPATITIGTSSPTAICQGGSITLTASSNGTAVSYSWNKTIGGIFTSNFATTQSINVTIAGSYSVNVKDANGCFSSNGINISVVQPPVVFNTSIQSSSICQGQSTLVTLNGSQSGVNYTLYKDGVSTGRTFSGNGSTITYGFINAIGTYTIIATTATGNCTANMNGTANLLVINPTPVVAPVTPATNSVCVGSTIQLLDVTAGGVWLTASPTLATVNSSGMVTGNSPGNVNIGYRVTDGNGCQGFSVVNVAVNPLPAVPVISAGGPTSFCPGGSVLLSSSAVTGNVWSSGQTTQSITVSQSGSYSVTATNVNGCTATSSNTSVTVNPLPVVTISASGSTILCSGGSVTLTANSGSSYAWSNGQTSQFVQISLPGRYTVTLTDANGCAATSLPVDIFPPNPILLAASAQGFNSCNGPNFGSANITSLVGGNTPYSVSWTGPNGFTSSLYSITNLTAGLYTVTAQDACGTTVSTSVTILAPAPQNQNVTVTGSTTLCSPQSTVRITAAAGAVSYSWNKIVNGVTTPVAGNANFIDVNEPGAYYVGMTDANGCYQNSNITDVFLVSPPATPIITATGPTTICSGGSVILTSSAVSGNIWSTGETTQSINVTQSGNYNITVTNANGCTSISANTTITVNPLPVVTISNGGPTSFCPGGSVILTSSSSTGNTWSPGGATTASFTAVQSGNYSVKVTDGNGCSVTSASVSVTASDIIPPVPSVSSLAALSLATTDPIPVPTATDNCTAGLINATTLDPISNLVAGTYIIHWTYTDNSGNSATQTQTVNIQVADITPPAFKTMNSIVKNNDPGVCGAVVTYPLPLANDNTSSTKISITEGGGDGTIVFTTPVTNNVSSLDFITSGDYQDIVHGHGTDIAVYVELFNPITNAWTRVQAIQTGTGDYHFGGSSVNFTTISQVSKIRFVASQPVFAAFHFYAMNVNLNSINIQQLTGLPSGAIFPIGNTVNSFRAVDLSGNAATASFTVTINDAEKPTIANYTASSNTADATGVWTGSASTIVIADNCPSALTLTEQYFDQRGNRFYNAQSSVSQGNYVLSTRSFPLGVNTVLVTVKDAAGNVSEAAKFNVTVLDVTNPTIVASGNITQSSDPGVCGAYVRVPVPVTKDNCSIQSVVNSFNGGPGASGRYPVGTTIILWTVTDGSGNKATTTQSITITDNEAPTIINLPVPVIQTNDAGTCGSVVTWAPVRATDNCGVVSFMSDHQSGETFPIGVTTVTFTAKDRNNNTGTASFTITVTDNEAPKVITKPVTVTLVNGAAGILPSSINNGSFDNCGAVTLAASKTNFTCADIGINKVTLTVTDLYGNAASAIALVTVIGEVPTSTVQVTPANTVFTGGVPTDIYLGYGPQSVTLTDNVVGVTPITYSWAGAGLNCVSCQSPVFAPTVAGSNTFVVTATNKYGCATTSTVAVCVRDIRVTQTANSKVSVCHTDLNTGATSTLQLAVNAVANQLTLNPQDLLGSCGMAPCTASTGVASVAIISNPVNGTVVNNATKEVPAAVDYDGPLTVTVSPNPSASVFTLLIRSQKKLPVSVRLVDEFGRSVEAKDNAPVGAAFTMGAKLITGIYFAEIIQGKERVVVKLIKQNR